MPETYIGINIVRKDNNIMILFDDYNKGISNLDNFDKDNIISLLETMEMTIAKVKSKYNIK